MRYFSPQASVKGLLELKINLNKAITEFLARNPLVTLSETEVESKIVGLLFDLDSLVNDELMCYGWGREIDH